MLWQDTETNLSMTPSTGEIRDDRNYMSMLEDFWLCQRWKGTDITTLHGGQESRRNIRYRIL